MATGQMCLRLGVPLGMEDLLEGLAREVLRHQPKDIYQFAAAHYKGLLLQRDYATAQALVSSPPLTEVNNEELPLENAQCTTESNDSQRKSPLNESGSESVNSHPTEFSENQDTSEKLIDSEENCNDVALQKTKINNIDIGTIALEESNSSDQNSGELRSSSLSRENTDENEPQPHVSDILKESSDVETEVNDALPVSPSKNLTENDVLNESVCSPNSSNTSSLPPNNIGDDGNKLEPVDDMATAVQDESSASKAEDDVKQKLTLALGETSAPEDSEADTTLPMEPTDNSEDNNGEKQSIDNSSPSKSIEEVSCSLVSKKLSELGSEDFKPPTPEIVALAPSPNTSTCDEISLALPQEDVPEEPVVDELAIEAEDEVKEESQGEGEVKSRSSTSMELMHEKMDSESENAEDKKLTLSEDKENKSAEAEETSPQGEKENENSHTIGEEENEASLKIDGIDNLENEPLESEKQEEIEASLDNLELDVQGSVCTPIKNTEDDTIEQDEALPESQQNVEETDENINTSELKEEIENTEELSVKESGEENDENQNDISLEQEISEGVDTQNRNVIELESEKDEDSGELQQIIPNNTQTAEVQEETTVATNDLPLLDEPTQEIQNSKKTEVDDTVLNEETSEPTSSVLDEQNKVDEVEIIEENTEVVNECEEVSSSQIEDAKGNEPDMNSDNVQYNLNSEYLVTLVSLQEVGIDNQEEGASLNMDLPNGNTAPLEVDQTDNDNNNRDDSSVLSKVDCDEENIQDANENSDDHSSAAKNDFLELAQSTVAEVEKEVEKLMTSKCSADLENTETATSLEENMESVAIADEQEQKSNISEEKEQMVDSDLKVDLSQENVDTLPTQSSAEQDTVILKSNEEKECSSDKSSLVFSSDNQSLGAVQSVVIRYSPGSQAVSDHAQEIKLSEKSKEELLKEEEEIACTIIAAARSLEDAGDAMRTMGDCPKDVGNVSVSASELAEDTFTQTESSEDTPLLHHENQSNISVVIEPIDLSALDESENIDKSLSETLVTEDSNKNEPERDGLRSQESSQFHVEEISSESDGMLAVDDVLENSTAVNEVIQDGDITEPIEEEKLIHAATKIQASFRGYQTRKSFNVESSDQGQSVLNEQPIEEQMQMWRAVPATVLEDDMDLLALSSRPSPFAEACPCLSEEDSSSAALEKLVQNSTLVAATPLTYTEPSCPAPPPPPNNYLRTAYSSSGECADVSASVTEPFSWNGTSRVLDEESGELITPAPDEDASVWATLERELGETQDRAATRIQASYRGHRARQSLLQRGDAMQLASSTSDNNPTSWHARHTGEFHDSLPLLPLSSVANQKEQSTTDGEGIATQNFGISDQIALQTENETEISLVEAVIKIQSTYRGYKTRNEIKNRDKSYPMGIEEDSDLVNAVTKIQAGFRGYRARKGRKKEAVRPSLVRSNSVSSPQAILDEEQSIIKIQAGVRGYLTRKRLNIERNQDSPPQSSMMSNPESGELEETVYAVIKLQAGYRGFKARQEVKNIRESKDN